MNPRLTQQKKGTSVFARSRWQWLFALAILFFVAYFTLGSRELWQMGDKKRDLAELEAEVARLQAETDSLRHVLWRLDNDPAFVEKVAREKYGMLKKGERVYSLPADEGE
jgi:cell division protein FtsB